MATKIKDKYATARPGDAGYLAIFVDTAKKFCNVYGPYPTRGKAQTQINRFRRDWAKAVEESGAEPLGLQHLMFVRPLLTEDMFGIISPKEVGDAGPGVP